MFVLVIALTLTFLLLPAAAAGTSPWIIRHILDGYGAVHLDDWLFAWKVLLALLIFAGVRAVLHVLTRAAGLLLALRLIPRRWRS